MPSIEIDLRSDTVTRPTAGMRKAMQAAPLGDDVFGEDPSVNALQEEVAIFLGQEAALFVPSGTMANQLALRGHTQPGDEVLVHEQAHIIRAEGAAGAALAGVQFRVAGSAEGLINTADIDARFQDGNNPHFAPTTLLCLENTHNFAGGAVQAFEDLDVSCRHARKLGVKTHLDGARLLNACTKLDIAPARMASAFDSVSLCFSKGLGAPVGSVICGSRAFVRRCYRYRKMYGGGMRQVGQLAAAARYALEHHVERLCEDHAHAQRLAEALSARGEVSLPFGMPQSNMVFFDWHDETRSLHDFLGRLAEEGIAIMAMSATRARAVTHLDVSTAEVERVCARVRQD